MYDVVLFSEFLCTPQIHTYVSQTLSTIRCFSNSNFSLVWISLVLISVDYGVFAVLNRRDLRCRLIYVDEESKSCGAKFNSTFYHLKRQKEKL